MISFRSRRLFMSILLFFISYLPLSTSFANENKTNTKDTTRPEVTSDSYAYTTESINEVISNISINGKVKIDVIYDLDSPSGDRVNYSEIPTGEVYAKGHTRIHARESRVNLKYNQDVKGNEFIAFIEGDFFGGGSNSPAGSEKISNSSNFRLRHAYLSYNQWLVGQTWSNYVDSTSFPETLDFSNETGQSFVRQGQIRYQHALDNFLLSYSIENPETDVFFLLSDEDEDEDDLEDLIQSDPVFDFTAKAKYRSRWGHISLQVVARKQKVYVGSQSSSEIGYGAGASGKINFSSQDTLRFHYSQGEGIGRYIQEAAGAAGFVPLPPLVPENKAPSINLLKTKGGYVGYQHRFTNKLRVNINSGFIDIDYSSVAAHPLLAERMRKINSFHGNLIWTVFPRLDIGIEHTTIKLTTVEGERGSVKRIQLSTIYRF